MLSFQYEELRLHWRLIPMFSSVQNAVSCSGKILGFPPATRKQQRIKYKSPEYFRSFFLYGVAAPSGPGSPHSRGF